MTRSVEVPDLVASLLHVLAAADGVTVGELLARLVQDELGRREVKPNPTPPPIMLPVAIEVVIRLLASLEGLEPVELLKRLVRDEVARTAPGLDGYLKEKLAKFQAGLEE